MTVWPSHPPAQRSTRLLAVGIVLLAAALRAGVAPILTLYDDEAQTMAVARFGFGDLLTCRAFDIGNPQGFHLLLSTVRQAFGEHVLLYRAVNALVGTAAVAMIMVLARALVPIPAVWLGVGLLTAINPMHLVFSLHVRPWAVQALTLSAAMWAVLRWRDRRRWGWLVLYVVAMFVAFNTNYSAVFCWAALGLWWLWDSRRDWRRLAAVVVTNLVLAGLLVPSVVFLWWQMTQQPVTRGGRVWLFHLLGFPYFFIYGNSVARPEWGAWLMIATGAPLLVVLAPVILAGLRAVWRNVQPRGLVLTMLVLPFAFLFVLCLFRPFFYSRYLAFIWPMFALVLVLGLRAFRPALRRAGWALLIVMELIGCVGYAVRFANDYPPFLLRTLQADAGQDFAVLTYPGGECQLALQWPSAGSSVEPPHADGRAAHTGWPGKARILGFAATQPGLEMLVFPDPPADYVKLWPMPKRLLPAMLAANELPQEVWFYCDLRPTGERRDAADVLSRVTQLLSAQYRLEHTYLWPSDRDPKIHLLKFNRVQ